MSEPAPAESPLRSVHTTSLPGLMEQFGLTVLITTYQAGKLIVVRPEGGRANTHFRNFDTPMGLAVRAGRLAVGTRIGIWEFHNVPAAAAKLTPPGRYDACYLPREIHVTGHIAIHDIAYAGTELWAVNTRFSCLCTFDRSCSFVPRWRPPFVTALDPNDRCHLNGLAMLDGAPRYVTALGTTDSAVDWRAAKANGGALMEVPSGRVVVGGLSMPHSPRFHEGTLWVLESGAGSLAKVDLAAGKLETVALVPGFTRGLDFFGPYAFIGLSQVRETALFSGIPITDRLKPEERACGLWVVDTRNGQTIAFLRFQAGVQEIFAVQVLPGQRFPELLNEDRNETIDTTYVLPDAALADVAQKPPA